MSLNHSVKSYLDQCEHQIALLEEKMKDLPEERLHINTTGQYIVWRATDSQGVRRNIPKSCEKEAARLALRKFYEAQLHDLKNEAEACRRYDRYAGHSVSQVEILLEKEPPEFRRLLALVLRQTDEKVRAWEEAPYEKSKNRPEELIHPTMKEDEKVRSKYEAMFAVCLKTLELPYQYEKILHINEWDVAADFTVLDVRISREVPVELFGMMDKPDYRKGYERKMKTYIDGGYIPGVNMLTFFESSANPLSQGDMMEELERFFFRKPPIRLT